MRSRIILPFLLFILSACSAANPIVGEWVSEEIDGELLLSQQSNKFQVSLTSKGENQGIFPAEVSDKGFTFVVNNSGLGSTQYNCSLATKKDEVDCNVLVSTLFGSQTRQLKLVRKK